jgi:hypothetical protein
MWGVHGLEVYGGVVRVGEFEGVVAQARRIALGLVGTLSAACAQRRAKRRRFACSLYARNTSDRHRTHHRTRTRTQHALSSCGPHERKE